MFKSILHESSDFLEQKIAKRLIFPDGLERIIVIRRSQWNMMEYIALNDGSGSEQETIDMAYELALEFHDPRVMSFEDQLRDCLDAAIQGSMASLQRFQRKIIQDNRATRSG